jgi:hypothetical protein
VPASDRVFSSCCELNTVYKLGIFTLLVLPNIDFKAANRITTTKIAIKISNKRILNDLPLTTDRIGEEGLGVLLKKAYGSLEDGGVVG